MSLEMKSPTHKALSKEFPYNLLNFQESETPLQPNFRCLSIESKFESKSCSFFFCTFKEVDFLSENVFRTEKVLKHIL